MRRMNAGGSGDADRNRKRLRDEEKLRAERG